MFHGSPLKNKRLFGLQSSFKTQNSSKSSKGLDSFSSNFNLQLDKDRKMFSDHDMFNDEKKTELKEREILSQLRLEGSFDVCKSLEDTHWVSEISASANELTVGTSRKKRIARIYGEDKEEQMQQS